MMTFTYSHTNSRSKITIELDEESSIEDVMQAFRAFLLGVGYSAELVAEWLGENP